MKKLIIITFIAIVLPFALLKVSSLYAQDTNENDSQRSTLEKQIAEYEAKLEAIKSEKNTLSSQIEYMDTQIYITGLRVQETEEKIVETEDEIDKLGNRIEDLDGSLDRLSETLLERIVAGYKNRQLSLFDIVLDSNNSAKLVNRLKYYNVARDSNQKVLLQVQEAKLNYEEQKDIREKKVEELDTLSKQLTAQKANLADQQAAKQSLLATTKNDEKTYQSLLEQAQNQLKSFSSFVQTSGAGSIIAANNFGNGSDGNYFSQRDERWATQLIGYSSENVLNVGCLITSIAMVGKKVGASVDPGAIARDTNRFWGNTAWMNKPWPGVGGKNYTSVSNIDDELSQGNYVIVGVKINNCSSGGNHFVVLTKKDGDDYIMHDPIYGPDTKFSDHYSTICSSATFK